MAKSRRKPKKSVRDVGAASLSIADALPEAEFRALTELTDRRLRQLADEGFFPPPKMAVYQRGPALAGFIRYQRELLHKKDETVAAEQKKLIKARRETVEEELAILRAQYTKVSELVPALRTASQRQRALLQRKLENELGPKLRGKSYEEIQKLLAGVVDEICAIMRDELLKWFKEDAA